MNPQTNENNHNWTPKSDKKTAQNVSIPTSTPIIVSPTISELIQNHTINQENEINKEVVSNDQQQSSDTFNDDHNTNSTNTNNTTETNTYLHTLNQTNSNGVNHTTTTNTNPFQTLLQHQHKRIIHHLEQLEMALTMKETQIVEERQHHMKTIREMKEGYEDQIQALQMRLYISETRLKNYEDALEQHIQTVKKNIPNA